MFTKIMIPVDLLHTDQLDKALAIAAGLARDHGAALHMVGVTMSAPTESAPTPEKFAEKLRAFADEQSRKLDMPFETHAEISHDVAVDLDDILMRSADKIGADLIVMASHIPGLTEYIFASNAGYLASHATISVLVVR